MFQEFNARAFASGQALPPPPIKAQEARELIERYPNLSEFELARVTNLYHELSALDMALMLSDEGLAPKLDRFVKDRRSKVRPPFHHYAALLGYGLVGIAVLVWAAMFAS